jgi:hypothetical protein
MDIASVIVTFVLTCRVLPRSILDSRSDLPAFCPSSAKHANVNFFLFNRFRTLSSFFGAGAFDNSFTINSFRTLLQKPGGRYTPPESQESLSLPTGLLSCRRRPVEVPLFSNGKRPLSLFSSYRYPTLSIRTRGGTPLPLLPAAFPSKSSLRASVPPCLCGYLSPLPRRELVGDLCYSSSPQRSFQLCFFLVVLSHFPSQSCF